MSFEIFTIQDWITIVLLIAQAGILYHRLKRVEQAAEKFTEMMLSMAVLKNSFEHQKKEFERFAKSSDRAFQKIDDRVSGIESHAYQALLANSKNEN